MMVQHCLLKNDDWKTILLSFGAVFLGAMYVKLPGRSGKKRLITNSISQRVGLQRSQWFLDDADHYASQCSIYCVRLVLKFPGLVTWIVSEDLQRSCSDLRAKIHHHFGVLCFPSWDHSVKDMLKMIKTAGCDWYICIICSHCLNNIQYIYNYIYTYQERVFPLEKYATN